LRKTRFMDQSTFICTTCGKTFPLMRSHGQHRERGHIKDLWCPFCKAERKFREVKRGEGYMTAAGMIYM